MTSIALRRFAHAAVGALIPGVGGRWATDVFSRTRALGTEPDNVLPLGARRFTIEGNPDVSGGYLWGDDGPTALLVHGWGADSTSMYSLITPLRELGYRVAAFDAPAHGVSEGKQATMTQYTAAVRAALDSLGGARVIVAHSLGSIAAVGAVALRPEEPVDCVALVAPTCTLTAVLESWSKGELRLARPIVDRIYRELHRRNGVPVSHWDVVGLGRDLDIPVLAIHDPDDPVVPFCEAENVVAGLRDARLLTAPGRGHMGILMSPEVKSAISAFVAEHGTRTGETIP
ncbi:alpha/beta fold hydrolase [Streptomyces sp. ISL-11]|uniref:alpha/beta fold hydrolase n=1 Tax=Streptomyces sp. ISL-11 TaxID=2819174 RepID=UPI001BEA765C|nr:alpha/beta hydrolase [Streptomyces sp. ISL-11]MBT2383960.1 alpha/beta hydrolase [Streptomyces sp. ISL-11]